MMGGNRTQSPKWVKQRVRIQSPEQRARTIRRLITTIMVISLIAVTSYGIYMYTTFVDSHDLLLHQHLTQREVPHPVLYADIATNGDLVTVADYPNRIYLSVLMNGNLIARAKNPENGGEVRLTHTLPMDRLGLHKVTVIAEPQDRPDKRSSVDFVINIARDGVYIVNKSVSLPD